MESAIEIKRAAREHALTTWLATDCALSRISLQPMPSDASFRRYFRLQASQESFVVMDAPPPENCTPFVAIANALRHQGLTTPCIIQADIEQGFLLLSDFGDLTYLKALNKNNATTLYHRALDTLIVLQNCKTVSGWQIPLFTQDFMWQEWAWHQEWFIKKFLQLELTENESVALDRCYAHLVASASAQPQVLMHRDYHSANLMVIENEKVGLLDFQDAFIGPLTYDLVSLLRDCYIDWPKEIVDEWALYYWQQTQHALMIDQQTFLRWFDWMGIQRHLKALLTFARKEVRDHNPHYLKHIPRTLNYVLEVSAIYSELKALHNFIATCVLPIVAKKELSCVP